MKTHDPLISFIVVHIIPVTQWGQLSYRRKKDFHYLVTSTGKSIALKPLLAPISCIEVAFVGSNRKAQDNGALYVLLQDLWAVHPNAEILYADELRERSGQSVMVMIARCLVQHLPGWIQRMLPRWNSLFTLRSLLPLIY